MCCWNVDSAGARIETTYPRGASFAIDFETLFSRLHTLKLSPSADSQDQAISSNLFPALPCSLTLLEAPIIIRYFDEASHLSRLPPGLLHLTGPIKWLVDPPPGSKIASSDDAIEELRLDFSNAPLDLQTFTPADSQVWAKSDELNSHSVECWLHKSILEISCLEQEIFWSPALSRSMPTILHTLWLVQVYVDSFNEIARTGWRHFLRRSPRSSFVLCLNPTSASTFRPSVAHFHLD